MAHFAKLGINGKVISVVPVNNSDLLNADGVEDESVGQEYLQTHNNWPAELWIQTSYNTIGNQHKLGGTPFRGNYACIGSIWDEENQIFWPPKPFSSWVKSFTDFDWHSPIGDAPELTEEQNSQNLAGTHSWFYKWNEENQTWDLTNNLA